MTPTILCIGQSDSSAGTGIQGDIKTALAHGMYAATAITAICAQNTQGIYETHNIPLDVVSWQIRSVLEDLEPKVIKIGMLGQTDVINMVGDFLDTKKDGRKVVIDPVMTNRADNILLEKEAKDALKRRLLIHADVLTPNVAEISDLSGAEIKDVDQLTHAANMMHTLGAQTVIAKGGDLPGEEIYDLLLDETGSTVYKTKRSSTLNTHGAGTTLATGIACGLAMGMSTQEAFERAHKFMCAAVEAGPKYGKGKHGPLNHAVKIGD
jgi:hydroxymethylpyrimidine/phosphomethylpyrimidine kinase